MSGVQPSFAPGMFTSAPRCSRNRATSGHLWLAAKWRAQCPRCTALFTCAPCPIARLACSTLLVFAASKSKSSAFVFRSFSSCLRRAASCFSSADCFGVADADSFFTRGMPGVWSPPGVCDSTAWRFAGGAPFVCGRSGRFRTCTAGCGMLSPVFEKISWSILARHSRHASLSFSARPFARSYMVRSLWHCRFSSFSRSLSPWPEIFSWSSLILLRMLSESLQQLASVLTSAVAAAIISLMLNTPSL
mmetsp:Transcript_2082/g.4926  ORF Transcript_2082/g.4926 Transcript_2082/m.4926 type:complete len:247 (-) Transcript_2082:161-901(-)